MEKLKNILIITILLFISSSGNASLIENYSFNANTSYCGSEAGTAPCSSIFDHGLSGTFQVDLDSLNTSGNGWISWRNFLDFEATNSFSSWSLDELFNGGIAFNDWMIIDFSINAEQDYSNGWSFHDDGGGEALNIGGLGEYSQYDPYSGNGSLSGLRYCPSSGKFEGGSFFICAVDPVIVEVYGTIVEYSEPVIELIGQKTPTSISEPSILALMGLGLAGLGFARRRRDRQF